MLPLDAHLQIDVSINAPKAGKIVKFLAKEEDTVAVGQDLYTLDTDAQGGKPMRAALWDWQQTNERPDRRVEQQ